MANALTSNVLNVYAVSAVAGSVKLATVVPSIFTVIVSVNGVVTVPILIWKLSVAEPPAGIVTFCPSVAVSAAAMPPNHAQLFPANGGAAPPPVPHPATSQFGVPKFVEVCTVHNVHGVPASNVPSATRSDGVHEGLAVGVAVFVAVAVEVDVAVDVNVGAGVPVDVAVGVPPQLFVVMCRAHPPLMLPTSTPTSSRTYNDHVPFAVVPLNTDSATVAPTAGAGAGNTSDAVSKSVGLNVPLTI